MRIGGKMEDFILKQRDRYSLELKLRYLLKKAPQRRNRYAVSVYFFFPQPFRINRDTYDRISFYDNLKLYLRFNTPYFKVSELLDEKSDHSPLVRLEQMVRNHVEHAQPLVHERYIYESKMLGSVYKSMLRDSIRRLQKSLPENDRSEYVREQAAGMVKRLHLVARRFHSLTKEVATRPDMQPLAEHTRLIDEHMSLLLERYLTQFLEYCDYRKDPDSYRKLAKIITKEVAYRKEKGYATVLEDSADERKKEEYVYREKILKKFASEVLFFNVRTKNEVRKTEHILYAIAAGIAMIFATAAAFFGQIAYGRLTSSLFVILVLSYMMKDRMKDFFRDLFRKSVAWRFSDRRENVYDPVQKQKLATIQERVAFVPEDRLDEQIRRLRNRGTFERTMARTNAESILLYRKNIELKARSLWRTHKRIVGLADISIIDIENYLRFLAVQYGNIPVITSKNKIDIHSVQRVYHLNMILRYKTETDDIMRRFRLVVDAKGIRRIEPIKSGGRNARSGELRYSLVSSTTST